MLGRIIWYADLVESQSHHTNHPGQSFFRCFLLPGRGRDNCGSYRHYCQGHEADQRIQRTGFTYLIYQIISIPILISQNYRKVKRQIERWRQEGKEEKQTLSMQDSFRRRGMRFRHWHDKERSVEREKTQPIPIAF